MKLAPIIVNFKLYEQATGDEAVKLAKIHERVSEQTGVEIAVAVNALDLLRVASEVSIQVYAQHIDPVSYGSHTGHILPDMLAANEVVGTLLNHSEYQLDDDVLSASIKRVRELGLLTVVCADSPERAAEILKFMPDVLAVEPPELIGGDVSVSKADPGIIKRAAALVAKNKLYVGAGIKNSEDVKIALSLGASGILLASGVVKAADPYAVLMDLASAFK